MRVSSRARTSRRLAMPDALRSRYSLDALPGIPLNRDWQIESVRHSPREFGRVVCWRRAYGPAKQEPIHQVERTTASLGPRRILLAGYRVNRRPRAPNPGVSSSREGLNETP